MFGAKHLSLVLMRRKTSIGAQLEKEHLLQNQTCPKALFPSLAFVESSDSHLNGFEALHIAQKQRASKCQGHLNVKPVFHKTDKNSSSNFPP